MNGQIFTLEALIAMIILASSFILVSGLKQETRPVLYDYVLVSDVFEVIEKQYHFRLADSCRVGALSSEIINLMDFAENQTGRRTFVSCGSLSVPDDCTSHLTITRMVTYDELNEIVWRRVNIGICG